MGKINFIIKDDIDEKFRKEVFNRKGMKKGNLTEALEEAMMMWIKSNEVESLEKIALNAKESPDIRLEATKTLGSIGRMAIPALTRIAEKGFSETKIPARKGNLGMPIFRLENQKKEALSIIKEIHES